MKMSRKSIPAVAGSVGNVASFIHGILIGLNRFLGGLLTPVLNQWYPNG